MGIRGPIRIKLTNALLKSPLGDSGKKALPESESPN